MSSILKVGSNQTLFCVQSWPFCSCDTCAQDNAYPFQLFFWPN